MEEHHPELIAMTGETLMMCISALEYASSTMATNDTLIAWATARSIEWRLAVLKEAEDDGP